MGKDRSWCDWASRHEARAAGRQRGPRSPPADSVRTWRHLYRHGSIQPLSNEARTDLGNLTVSAPADVAVFSVQKGRYGFVDVYGAKLNGTQMIVPELTFRDGRIYWDLNGLARESWDKPEPGYGPQSSFTWDGEVSTGVRGRK